MRPEKNREVTIHFSPNTKRDGKFHDAYEIAVDGDFHDFLQGRFKAWLHSSNSVLVQLPSMDFSWLFEPELINNSIDSTGYSCDQTKDAHMVARNQIIANEDRLTNLFMLRWPREAPNGAAQQLTNIIYSPNSMDGEIQMEMVPFKSEFELAGKKYATTRVHVRWKVSIVELED